MLGRLFLILTLTRTAKTRYVYPSPRTLIGVRSVAQDSVTTASTIRTAKPRVSRAPRTSHVAYVQHANTAGKQVVAVLVGFLMRTSIYGLCCRNA